MADAATPAPEATVEEVPTTWEQQIADYENVEVPENEHRLETDWTLWLDKKKEVHCKNFADFKANLAQVSRFGSVEGFWRSFSFLAQPSRLPRDYDVFMFRKNMVPAWESFPAGGCWIIKVRKGNGLIDRLWEELAFAAIGEMFEEPTLVGVTVSTRAKDDVVAIWNSDNTNPATRFKIGEKLKVILNLDASTCIEYKAFSAAIQDGSTFRAAKQFMFAPKIPDSYRQSKSGKKKKKKSTKSSSSKKTSDDTASAAGASK
ncbi:MAG: hypothetical protein MHM6MM_001985 [Cercozoa sp. M6MM]